MHFNLEIEMQPIVESWLARRCSHIRREFALPWGVCDLVGCSLQLQQVKKRLKLKQRSPVGSISRVMLLMNIPDAQTRKSISLLKLCNLFDQTLGKTSVREHIDRLVDSGFLRLTARGNVQRLNGWVPLQKHIIAVELKLKRVEEVLSQARQNTEFVDYSYAALPMPVARNILLRKLHQFTEAGVGLLGVSSSRCVTLLKPRRMQVNQALQMHAVERFWRDEVAPRDKQA